MLSVSCQVSLMLTLTWMPLMFSRISLLYDLTCRIRKNTVSYYEYSHMCYYLRTLLKVTYSHPVLIAKMEKKSEVTFPLLLWWRSSVWPSIFFASRCSVRCKVMYILSLRSLVNDLRPTVICFYIQVRDLNSHICECENEWSWYEWIS